MPGEAHASLGCTHRKQSQPFQRAPGPSPAIADEPSPPGGSAEWDPAAPAACALPRGAGPAVEALGLLLTGAALFFSAMLCLWRERSRHQLRRERLCTQLPPALCQGRGMHHPVLWRLQVRALSSSQAREEPAVTPPRSLTEPEPGPGGSFLVPCPPRSTSHRAHPFHLPPGPSAGSTALNRPLRKLQQKAPSASSAWSLWGTACPTTPWCAQPANTSGSTGTASR